MSSFPLAIELSRKEVLLSEDGRTNHFKRGSCRNHYFDSGKQSSRNGNYSEANNESFGLEFFLFRTNTELAATIMLKIHFILSDNV